MNLPQTKLCARVHGYFAVPDYVGLLLIVAHHRDLPSKIEHSVLHRVPSMSLIRKLEDKLDLHEHAGSRNSMYKRLDNHCGDLIHRMRTTSPLESGKKKTSNRYSSITNHSDDDSFEVQNFRVQVPSKISDTCFLIEFKCHTGWDMLKTYPRSTDATAKKLKVKNRLVLGPILSHTVPVELQWYRSSGQQQLI